MLYIKNISAYFFTIISSLVLLFSCGIDSKNTVTNEEPNTVNPPTIIVEPTTSCQQNTKNLANTTSTNSNPSSKLIRDSNYELVWQDNFDGTTLNRTYWNYDLGSPLLGGTVWGNNEQQHYTSSEENVCVQNGYLSIQPIQGTPTQGNIAEGGTVVAENIIATSGRILTKTTAFRNLIGTYPYGYYEIRAKLSCIKGSWPALWLLGFDGNWPDQGELDMMEWSGRYYGNNENRVSSAIHTRDNHGGNYIGGNDLHDGVCSDFQNYQMHWTENYVAFGVNEKVHFVYEKPEDANNNNWPFYKPAFFIMNVAVGGNLGGDLNDHFSLSDIENMTMIVDYVKVWQDQSFD